LAKKEYVVNSVLKALDILEVLDDQSNLGVSEIARRLDMEKSTVYRLINSLKLRGYVQQDPDTHRYMNGFRLFEMGNNVVKNMGLRKQAFPFLQELSQRTKEAVNLAVRDGKNVVYIDKMESSATIKVDLVVGKRMPMYCTGLGKVLLAYLPPELVEELLQNEVFEQFTPNTHTSLVSLMSELEVIREQGFGWDNEEYVLDLVCIAAPVFGVGDEIVAALSVALPKFRYASDTAKYEEAKDHVVEVAEKLTIALKGSGY